MSLESLHNVWQGQTVYVLGSGPSLNFLDKTFFDDKNCVAINYVGHEFGLKKFTSFTHYGDDALFMADHYPHLDVVVREWHLGKRVTEILPNMHVVPCENVDPPGESFDPESWGGLGLVFGSSSIHGGMHLAAYMGAKHVVLVGADCGTIDGNNRFNGYPEGDTPWTLYEKHLRMMKEWLQVNFNCSVYSLNPFVNFNLEGHKFVGV
jgi:hypothetical protein